MILNEKQRRRIFGLLENHGEDDPASAHYDRVMLLVIYISLIPLGFREYTRTFFWLDKVTLLFFLMDYVLRLMTADFKLQKGKASFLYYPFTLTSLQDLLAILPSVVPIYGDFQMLKILRILWIIRLLRVFKTFRHSKNVRMIANVFRTQRDALIMVFALAAGYTAISALVMFYVEPETFPGYSDALYWAVITLTTVGYGDICPVSAAGRVVTILSSVLGILIIALPSGLITAGYMEELKKASEIRESQESQQEICGEKEESCVVKEEAMEKAAVTSESSGSQQVLSGMKEGISIEKEEEREDSDHTAESRRQ